MANLRPSSSAIRSPGPAAGALHIRRPGRRQSPLGLRGRAAVTATAAIAISLAACAKKSDPPAISTVVDRDNAICKTYALRIGGIAAPAFDPAKATGKDLPAAPHYLDQVVPLTGEQQRNVKSVGGPNASRQSYASMLDALAAVVQDEQQDEQAARTAAHTGDLHAFQAAYRADAVDATHLCGVAQQLGLTACLAG